jgi:glycerol-3-phosphate dehydrogenase
MKRDPNRLQNRTFDLLVIGGGIHGAGVARDAALRGLSVALIEKNDFASATSSATSKLIHGGLRYLEGGHIKLVRESCRERALWLKLAPHLVKPLPILFPVYAPESPAKIRIGMMLYDALAAFQNVQRHKMLSASETLQLAPEISPKNLRAAALFYDATMDDARFCIEILRSAADAGAVCVNYIELIAFNFGKARVRDKISGDEFEIRAKNFVNAAGPWVESIAKLNAPADGSRVKLRPTKGIHIVLPRQFSHANAVFWLARRDRRLIFCRPFAENLSLLGTTDTDFRGNFDEIYADDADILYLLDEFSTQFPQKTARKSDIIATFAGVRALLDGDSRKPPSAVSREHRVVVHGNGLISIAGGKYTTFRAVAEKIVDKFTQKPCQTRKIPLAPRPPHTNFDGEIRDFVENEMAIHLTDVMRRRTNLAFSAQNGRETAERVARAMQPLRGWSDAETQREIEIYLEEMRKNHAPV